MNHELNTIYDKLTCITDAHDFYKERCRKLDEMYIDLFKKNKILNDEKSNLINELRINQSDYIKLSEICNQIIVNVNEYEKRLIEYDTRIIYLEKNLIHKFIIKFKLLFKQLLKGAK